MSKLRGWQQTLELLERGELSKSEIDALRSQLLPAFDDVIEQVKAGEKDAEDLGRVLQEARRELSRIDKDRKTLDRITRPRF